VCCQAQVSATGRSLVQRSPTDCAVSLRVIKKPRARGRHGPCWAAEPQSIMVKESTAIPLILLSSPQPVLGRTKCFYNYHHSNGYANTSPDLRCIRHYTRRTSLYQQSSCRRDDIVAVRRPLAPLALTVLSTTLCSSPFGAKAWWIHV
jgi:hypothetical protein